MNKMEWEGSFLKDLIRKFKKLIKQKGELWWMIMFLNWKWLGGEDDECKCKDCGEYFPAMGFYERILSNKGGYEVWQRRKIWNWN